MELQKETEPAADIPNPCPIGKPNLTVASQSYSITSGTPIESKFKQSIYNLESPI
jgi:hypothetical protein